jgi:dienelactone hydrolase
MRQRRVGSATAAFAGLALLVGVLAPLAAWALTVESVEVWPVRNTVQYAVASRWWQVVGAPRYGEAGEVTGKVRDESGGPIAGARVLLTRWDGTAYAARTGASQTYALRSVPAGSYTVVAGAARHDDAAGGHVSVRAASESRFDVVLRRAAAAQAASGSPRDVVLGQVETVESVIPLQGKAVRRRIVFSGGGPSEPAFLYTPRVAEARALLVVVYPGPAQEWEGASVPLAEAGYAVIATGPAYSFEPERHEDELVRLLRAAQAGLPVVGAADRIAVLGGSYSGVHVLRLLQREHGNAALKAAVLMGAPSDLFDMRRRLEDRSFVPPFGLDQALVALGFPDREALRYWRYSGAYHVRAGMPPMLLIHSRQDAVVPYQQSELLARTLAEEGVPHELHLLDGGSHYLLSQAGDARAIYELTLRFLRERLGA